MLDNVVDVNGLPLPEQREEIARKRRHGMGFLGLGSAMALLGMRYGSPTIASALDALRDAACDRLVVFPLYPPYASSSTGSTLELVYELTGRWWNTPFLQVVPPFYDEPGFLDAFAEVGKPVLRSLDPEVVLFSFHGLPERQIRKSDPTGRHCLASEACCETIGDANRFCYRAQCVATARGIAARLDVDAERYRITFQSRLGRTPWIRPYTDLVLPDLAREGVKRVAVFCPAFVADCLETLEEIQIRARESFKAAGGEELRLVPSLNAHPAWMDAAANLVRRMVGEREDAVETRS